MNTSFPVNISDIIDSLLNDRYDEEKPVIPDALLDISSVITGIRTLSFEGRVLHSDVQYSIAEMLGRLLKAYIPNEPTTENLTSAVLGLTILLARILRTVPQQFADMSIEEFLIEPSDQDDLIALGQQLSATPVITATDGHMRINLAQLPLFHAPTPITQETIDGFIARQIEPYDDFELPEDTPVLSLIEAAEMPTQTGDIFSDPLDGFDEFFDAYFERQDEE
jgi:hypothetical protein